MSEAVTSVVQGTIAKGINMGLRAAMEAALPGTSSVAVTRTLMISTGVDGGVRVKAAT